MEEGGGWAVLRGGHGEEGRIATTVRGRVRPERDEEK